MPRKSPNLLALARPASAEGTRTFTDPAQPGEELELSLMVTLDANFDAVITESHLDLMQKYVTGDTEFIRSKGEKGTPPITIFSPGTAIKIPVTKFQCLQISQLMAYEEAARKSSEGRGEEKWETFGFQEWLVLAERMPTAWGEILYFQNELMMESQSKNSLTASGAELSDSPSITN